jgi:hypothetical protein
MLAHTACCKTKARLSWEGEFPEPSGSREEENIVLSPSGMQFFQDFAFSNPAFFFRPVVKALELSLNF